MNVGAYLGKFSNVHSSLLCEVISHWLKSTADSNGRINWQDICAILNSKLSEKEGDDTIIYSEIDCHKHWRLLAYGEQHVDDDSQVDGLKVFQHSEDSDEESFYMYPMQAIARTVPRSKHASIPILAQNAALVKSCKTVCDTRTNSSVDDSDSNRNSEEVRVIQSNETDSHTSSSSSGIQGKPTLHSDIDSTIDSSDGSTDPLLRKPEQHNSRNTKMFVSSQIHSGEVTMKHILFTFSKDPFEKISNIGPTGLCLSSLGENQSFVSGKRNLSRLPAPTSRAFQPVLTNVVAAPQAPTSSSASSSYATVERSRQTPQSISPRQPYTGSTSQNQSSSTGHAGHSTGASQYYDLTESACNGNDSNTHRNATTLSNSLSSSDQKGSYLQERDIRYGNGAVGTDHIAEHNTRHAEHDSALLQQQRQQHSLQQLQYQQQQLQQQQRQQYEQNKQQSEQYQYQQSSYWNSVMERTSGSARPAHPIMTRDEQYRSISNSQSNRNHGAHADSLNDHQAQGGYSFRQTDGPASSSVGSWAHPTADQNHPLQHSNELSVTHPDYTYQQHAFIPNGNSTQTGSANGHCPSPQSKNASHSNNSSSEKKRKREKLQYVNFVQKSIQSDFKRQKASCDGSYDRFQDHSNGQIKSNGQDQRSRSGSLKDESGFISVKDPSYNKNEHRQNQNGTALAALLPSSSQSHISYALYDSAPTLPGNRYSDHSSSVPSDGSSSSQVSLGSRPQGSIPQSDNDLAVLLLAISGTPSQISAPSLSLPTLDLNSFTSNMDKHYPSNHSDHKASYAHQSHIGGDVAVKHMNSPPQLLDPL